MQQIVYKCFVQRSKAAAVNKQTFANLLCGRKEHTIKDEILCMPV